MHAECAKCGGLMFNWNHVLGGTHQEQAGGCLPFVTMNPDGEHLDLTCRNCGWVFGMRTKDADGR